MIATGKLVSAAKDWQSGKMRITFEVNEAPKEALEEIAALDMLDIEAKRHAKKRSLDANAYFHVLVGKIADKTRISKPRTKNMLLGAYGQREMESGRPVILSVREDIDMMEWEVIHTIAIGCGEVNGKMFTHWAVIRPSHTYTSEEMSILIDGTVQEAQLLGIETATPDELERMKALYEKHHAAR